MRLSKSSSSQARWSGKSVSAFNAWLVVWRVVSLPATASNTKNVGVGQAVTVDFGVDQGAEQIVPGILASIRGEPESHLVDVHLRFEKHLQGVAAREVDGVGPGAHGIGGVCDALTLRLRNAHHVRQRADGQFLAAVLDEIDPTTCGFELINDGLGVGFDRILDTPDLARGERGADKFAEEGVPGWIHRQERLRRFEKLLGHILEKNALSGEERLVVAADRDNVVAASDRPVAGVVGISHQGVFDGGMPAHRAFGPQLGE